MRCKGDSANADVDVDVVVVVDGDGDGLGAGAATASGSAAGLDPSAGAASGADRFDLFDGARVMLRRSLIHGSREFNVPIFL